MKRKLTAIVMCIVSLICSCSYAEDEPVPESYTVRNGSKRAAFSYPAECWIVDDDDLGVFVHLNDENYIAVSIPRRGLSGTEQLHENIHNMGIITELTNDFHIFAVHGDYNHRNPYIDIVEIGMNLEDGTGIIVNITCPYGRTEIYDAAKVIVNSMMDGSVFEEWLMNVWIPYVEK